MQIVGHHGESGRDDTALIALAADNIKSNSGAHIYDDGRNAVEFLRRDCVGDTVFPDLMGFWVG